MGDVMCIVRIVAIVSLVLAGGSPYGAANAADSREQRFDRNLATARVESPTVPAVPASKIRVSKGRLTVPFGYQKHELETLTAMPPGAGPFPLAVISHGVPRSSKDRGKIRLRQLLPIAEDFAQRGYKSVVFARRGYATSSGSYKDSYGKCKSVTTSSYVRAARNGAKDYEAVIKTLAREPDIDGSRVVAVGQSGGGFAVSALASRPPNGLVAVISFAGGRGAQKDLTNCNETAFVRAYGKFGKKARVPALWLYSTADRFFWPELVDRALSAYADSGAPVRLERVGRLWFYHDGHRLSRLGGRELWRPRIDAFLKVVGAPNWQSSPGDGAVARVPAPQSLDKRGRNRWRRYLGEAKHKAFALGTGPRFGWQTDRDTVEEAVKAAMGFCEAKGDRCRVVSIDGEIVRNAGVAKVPAPPSLNERGRNRWHRYLGEAKHKAFALGTGPRFGWATGRDTVEQAVRDAMGFCEAKGDRCRVVSVDGGTVP